MMNQQVVSIDYGKQSEKNEVSSYSAVGHAVILMHSPKIHYAET